ncbi:hypothetical protein [Roseovarius aestuariivivens]|uniref:hypothetical protein n=1 Tax=Roseovarius aestuariivivens TaxID=1888910 RepID=UPI0014366DCA|nr:hypothetical protein [Roseovarius aestuariivivens]
MLIVASAGLGVVVGGLELSDRFFTTDDRPVVDTRPAGTVTAADAGGQTGAQPDNPDPDTAPVDAPSLSQIERDLGQRIREALAAHCDGGLSLREVAASERRTPAAETSSGLEGYYLEGEAVVLADGTPHRLWLLGTGKGPDAARAARAMAMRGFSDQIRASDALKVYCKES